MRIGSGRTVVFKRGEEAWFLETGVVGLRKGPSWSVLGSWYSRQALGFLGGGGRCSGGRWFGDPPRRPEWPGAFVSRRLGGGKWEMIHAPAGDGAWIVGYDRPGLLGSEGVGVAWHWHGHAGLARDSMAVDRVSVSQHSPPRAARRPDTRHGAGDGGWLRQSRRFCVFGKSDTTDGSAMLCSAHPTRAANREQHMPQAFDCRRPSVAGWQAQAKTPSPTRRFLTGENPVARNKPLEKPDLLPSPGPT